MVIKYNNSLYSEPPSIILPTLPDEEMDWKIRTHIDEEKYDNGFIDLEAERNRELIKWEKLNNMIMPLKATTTEF